MSGPSAGGHRSRQDVAPSPSSSASLWLAHAVSRTSPRATLVRASREAYRHPTWRGASVSLGGLT
eukprot:2313351-Lingulodinium_polyedra.AAC.1